MAECSLHMLWATPIVQVKNPEHARIAPAVQAHCYEIQKKARSPIESGITPHLKSDLYESPFDLFTSTPLPEMQALHHFCMQSVGEVAAQLRAQQRPGEHLGQIAVHIFESWVHITRSGGYHDPHIHTNCSWCGIYYLQKGDCTLNPPNGTNRFFPPIEPTFSDLGTEAYLSSAFQICPEDGTLVLFPSYIRHSGTPYRGERDRILIAFNARVFRPEGTAAPGQ